MRTSSQSSPTDFARFSETLVLMKKRAESLGLYPRSQSLLLKNNLGSANVFLSNWGVGRIINEVKTPPQHLASAKIPNRLTYQENSEHLSNSPELKPSRQFDGGKEYLQRNFFFYAMAA